MAYVPPSQRRVNAPASAGPVRRAEPPRPTMLVGPVGDIGACQRAFADLQLRVAQLKTQDLSLGAGDAPGSGGSKPSDWQALVPKFRSLRESLTAAGCTDVIAVEAYEAAAETCLRAGDNGEFLKCLQRLVKELYPLHAGSPAAARLGEFAACVALYFAVVPTPPDAAEVRMSLRGLPTDLLRCKEVVVALRALAALGAGDYQWLCWAAAAPDAEVPVLLRGMLQMRVAQVRERALRVMSAAYRQMPVAAAERILRLPAGGDTVGACVAAVAALEKGSTPGLKIAAQKWADGLAGGGKLPDFVFAK